MGRTAKKCGASESCSLPVDVILHSSDGEQFGAHSRNLEMFSDAFPMAGSTVPPDGDIVKLTEKAEILRLMLCFTHNMPSPDLTSLDIQTLFSLGETVKLKYGMHYASECVSREINKRAVTHPNPLEILVYKIRVSDLSMIDDVARRTMDIPLQEVVGVLANLETFRTWVCYREKWQPKLAKYHAASTRYSKSRVVSAEEIPRVSDVIGLPSIATAKTTMAIFGQDNSLSIWSDIVVAAEPAGKMVLEAVNQFPLWKDFL